MKLRLSVNIKDILRVQVGFKCLLSIKGIMLLMLPLTCKGLASTDSLLLIYINTLWLYVYVLAAMPLMCINTLWLVVYVRYTL